MRIRNEEQNEEEEKKTISHTKCSAVEWCSDQNRLQYMHTANTCMNEDGCSNVFKHIRCLKMITSKLNRIRFCCKKYPIFFPFTHNKYVFMHGYMDCMQWNWLFCYCRLKIFTFHSICLCRMFHSLNIRNKKETAVTANTWRGNMDFDWKGLMMHLTKNMRWIVNSDRH